MRAARILQMLLILQNRGRQTSRQLSEELEVTPRTILRDVDALTEAGLPIIVFQGNQGGIELGFGYRTHLTGLAADEAEALAVILNTPIPQLTQLGMQKTANRTRAKLIEALPTAVREKLATASDRFRFAPIPEQPIDIRIAAFADAIRNQNIIQIRSRHATKQEIHPVCLTFDAGWSITDQKSGQAIPLADCHDINISAKKFTIAAQ